MIDFYGIQEAIQTTLAPVTANVFIEAMDRDFSFTNMPMINIRLTEGNFEIITLPNGYYAIPVYEIDVMTFDLSEFKKAANLRDDLLSSAMLTLRSNTSLGGLVQSLKIGQNVQFSAGTPEQGGGHLAIGTFRVSVESYVDP